jgi:hypothetical protein
MEWEHPIENFPFQIGNGKFANFPFPFPMGMGNLGIFPFSFPKMGMGFLNPIR